jgi:hypothetical protein
VQVVTGQCVHQSIHDGVVRPQTAVDHHITIVGRRFEEVGAAAVDNPTSPSAGPGSSDYEDGAAS